MTAVLVPQLGVCRVRRARPSLFLKSAPARAQPTLACAQHCACHCWRPQEACVPCLHPTTGKRADALPHTLVNVRRATLCTIATAASACIAHAASWYAIQGAAHPPAPQILSRLHTRLFYLIPTLMHDQYQPCTLPSLHARALPRHCNTVCFISQQGHACE